MTGYVYILRSKKDDKKYIGSTIDIIRRLTEHNRGKVLSTKNRQPLVLEMYQICRTIQQAAKLEQKYKKSHGFLDRAIKKGKFIILKTGE